MFRSKEQTRFHRLISGAMRPGKPLLASGEPGLGKTHAYALALLSSGKKVAIAFPTRDLISQFLGSRALSDTLAELSRQAPSIAELKSSRFFDTDSDYAEHKRQALQADVLLITHAAAYIDAFSGKYIGLAKSREVILFDEADLLADAADLQSALSFTAAQLKSMKIKGLSPRDALLKIQKQSQSEEDIIAAKIMLRGLGMMQSAKDWKDDQTDTSALGPRDYKRVGYNARGDLVLRHRSPGRMLKPLINHAARCIFVSGTLQAMGSFDYFAASVGIESFDSASNHIEPMQHGSLRVLCARDELSLSVKAEYIAAAKKPVLVLATSHASAYALHAHLPGSCVRLPGEKLAECLDKCADDGTFITAGGWSGLDVPRLKWATVVIPETPYGVPVEIDGNYITSFCDSAVTAVRRTRQGLYRGLRSPESSCTLLLLDPRSSRPALKKAVPARFEFGHLEKPPINPAHLEPAGRQDSAYF